MKTTIRKETKSDFRKVEEITRKAFWNIHELGCNEHYLVHKMREHEDFIPELDFVYEVNGKLVANIMYTKSRLIDLDGNEKTVLTFGPLSVVPEYQRRGIGKSLIEHSFQRAVEMGYDAVVIYGNPENYVKRGFKNGKRYNVGLGDDCFPAALLVNELKEGTLGGKKWIFKESSAYEIENKAAEEFDKTFEPMVKAYQPSQELFYIYSHSKVVW